MNSRAKGARGEREWAHVLRNRFPGLEFERGIQSRGGGKEAADVFGLPGFHMEVKYVEKLNIWAASHQAEDDADAQVIPVVVYRRNREPWRVSMLADDWLNLAGNYPVPGR